MWRALSTNQWPVKVILTLGFAAALVVSWITFAPQNYSIDLSNSVHNFGSRKHQIGPFWHGWSTVKSMFVLGDSYSMSFFDVAGAMPDAVNPMGNRDFFVEGGRFRPYFSRPIWIETLVTKHNSSLVKVYDLAKMGSIIDFAPRAPDGSVPAPEIIGPRGSLSFWHQLHVEFTNTFTSAGGNQQRATWQPDSTLFVVYFGVNDIMNALLAELYTPRGIPEPFYKDTIGNYASHVNDLYDTGARNFLFLNIPPIEQQPIYCNASRWKRHATDRAISEFNNRLSSTVSTFVQQHSDVTAFTFDLHRLFMQLLYDPKMYSETADMKVFNRWCRKYENGTDEPDTFVERCLFPVNQYFWQDGFHATGPVHGALARAVAEECWSDSTPMGLCHF